MEASQICCASIADYKTCVPLSYDPSENMFWHICARYCCANKELGRHIVVINEFICKFKSYYIEYLLILLSGKETDASRLFKVLRMVSSGMLRRVAIVRADVSEELIASFIRVTRNTSLQRQSVASYS
jgi:hypothetical protein